MRLALSMIQNHLGAVPRPSWCTYLVCYRCNARCQMCDSWRLRPGQELTPDQVRTVFGKLGRLDVVRLSGGEPFLRDDFAEVARAVYETSCPGVLHITSNGSFPEKIDAFVAGFPAPRRLQFMISFDGLDEEHDANRGQDVTFELACETVGRLVELRRRHGLKVSINHTVISARSLDDHEELRRRFSERDVDVHAVLAYEDSAMYGRKRTGHKANDLIIEGGYPLHPRLQDADVVGFVRRQLDHVKNMRDPLLRIGKRYYLRGLLARLTQRPDPRPRPKCVALRSHIRLLPDGRVPVCQFNTETIGNLVTQALEEVWRGAAARESRAWVDGCVGCWAECEVMPNALFTGDVVRGLMG
ncbi:MAG: radical SAM protein [Gemmataceae bacterium]